MYVVTTGPGSGHGLAVRVTKTRKKRKRVLVFQKPEKVDVSKPVASGGGTKEAREETGAVAAAGTSDQAAQPREGEASKAAEGGMKRVAGIAGRSEVGTSPETGGPAETKDVEGSGKAEEGGKAEASTTAASVQPVESASVEKQRKRGISQALFWTTATAALVSALASGGFRVWYRQEDAAYQAKLEEGATQEQLRSRRDKMVNLERVYVAFAGAAGIFAVTAGISAIFTDWDGDHEDDGASAVSWALPSLGVATNGFTLGWTLSF